MASLEDDEFSLISDAWASPLVTLDKNTIQPAAEIKKWQLHHRLFGFGIKLFEITGLTSSTGGTYTLFNALTPIEALN